MGVVAEALEGVFVPPPHDGDGIGLISVAKERREHPLEQSLLFVVAGLDEALQADGVVLDRTAGLREGEGRAVHAVGEGNLWQREVARAARLAVRPDELALVVDA